jgi:hypothetical protein
VLDHRGRTGLIRPGVALAARSGFGDAGDEHSFFAFGGINPALIFVRIQRGEPVKINHLADRLSVGAVVAALTALLVTASVAEARDTLQKFPLEAALAKAQASGKLAPGIKLFFGTQKYPKPTAQLGSARTNKKTNFFNKSDQEGCEWAFLSAMISLTQYAQRVGGNAIVNIRSNYKNSEFSSETEYECGAGNVTGGTAFVGDVVKLP